MADAAAIIRRGALSLCLVVFGRPTELLPRFVPARCLSCQAATDVKLWALDRVSFKVSQQATDRQQLP